MIDRIKRPITGTDRMLAYGDRIARAFGMVSKSRRRTHWRFGRLNVILVEEAGEPTMVYLENEGDGAIIQATATELGEAAAAVQKLLANPPPVRRKR